MVQIKSYFRETTIHGLKYLIDAPNIVERIFWAIAILVSFTIAGIFISFNIKESSQNPILTSVNSIPIQEAPFPAVTISGVELGHMNRFYENILNQIEFDCIQKGSQCIKQTKKARSDFEPLIKEALIGAQRRAQHYAQRGTREKLTDYLCLYKESVGSLGQLAVNYVEANHKVNDPWKLTEYVIDVIANTFRMPLKLSIQAVTDALIKYLPSQTFKRIKSDHECRWGLNYTFPMEAIETAAGILAAMSYGDTEHGLKLGQLMTIGPLEMSKRLTLQQKDFEKDTQRSLVKQLEGFMLQLLGENVKFTSSQLFDYMSLMSPIELNQNESIPCNVAAGNESISFCTADSSSSCCQLETELSGHRQVIMRAMKYNYAPASRLINENSQSSETKHFAKQLKYVLHTDDHINSNPVIVACSFGKEPLTPYCTPFSMLYNTKGVGYTFNNGPFWSVYKNTSENYAFYKEFYEKVNDKKDFHPKPTSSNDNAFTYIVKHSASRDKIKMVFNDPLEVPDLRNNFFVLEPGMGYYIHFYPSITVTDKGGQSLKLSQRKCRTRSENENLKIYNYYSQSACIFECQLLRAVSICKCSPWNYPVYNKTVPVCPAKIAKSCFEEIMESPFDVQSCECPNDCSFVQYSTSPIFEPLRIKDFCDNIDWFEKSLGIPDMWLNEFFTWNFLNPDLNFTYETQKSRCKELVQKEISFVKITLGSKTATQIIRTNRVSFSDQVANLGGIIGLFSGMSILSLAEIIYWTMRGLWQWLSRKFKKQSRPKDI